MTNGLLAREEALKPDIEPMYRLMGVQAVAIELLNKPTSGSGDSNLGGHLAQDGLVGSRGACRLVGLRHSGLRYGQAFAASPAHQGRSVVRLSAGSNLSAVSTDGHDDQQENRQNRNEHERVMKRF